MNEAPAAVATPPWPWLPKPEAAARELFPTAAHLPSLLDWLAGEQVNGAVSVRAEAYELVLLLLNGEPVVAHLTVGSSLPVLGQAAIQEFVEAIPPTTLAHTLVQQYPRPVVECLTALIDPAPATRPLTGVDALRATLRDQVTLGHQGLVDLVVGDRWSRALFHHGQLLGAYADDERMLGPSLAMAGRLAASGAGTVTVRSVPESGLPALRWPTANGQARPTRDDGRDEKIETNLLWLLSHIERDRDRAAQSRDARVRSLQALAGFTNSLYTFANQVAATGGVLRVSAVASGLRSEYALIEELDWKNDGIDTQDLARRFRALPHDEAVQSEFHRGVTRAILALTRQASERIIHQIADPGVRLRCATAIETWSASIAAETLAH